MSELNAAEFEADTPERARRRHLLLAIGIGALVGVGIAATWLPKRRRRRQRLPGMLARPYQRVKQTGGTAMNELRSGARDRVADFREEIGANLEAARVEFGDMARQQIGQLRKTLERERRKFLG